jgi:D-xylose transport system substrate-binding protein
MEGSSKMQLFRQRKTLHGFFSFLFIAILLAACGNSSGGSTTGTPTATASKGKDCNNVAILLPETGSSARWDGKDRPQLIEKIKAVTGKDPLYYNAEGNADRQQSQADAALNQGACVLIVAPYDQEKAAAIVTKAKSQGVPVIAYDRLIQSKDIAAYASFDGVRVGEIQGQYIADHYKDYLKGTNKNLVMINGSQTDDNAKLFYTGAINKLQPLIDSKALNKVYDQFTPDWAPENARTEIDGALNANANNLQIAYVANDNMANSVIAGLKAKQLAGHVLVTGQDADISGLQNILLGYQNMTVYKDIPKEAQSTADILKAIRAGTDIATVATRTSTLHDSSNVPAILLEPVAIDKANIQDIVTAGYATKDQICKGLPAGTGGFC